MDTLNNERYIGEFCEIQKECTTCKEVKHGSYFQKGIRRVCKTCRIKKKKESRVKRGLPKNKNKRKRPEKILAKMEKYKSISLDLSELNPSEHGMVKCIGFDFTWFKEIKYEKAIEMVGNGVAQVHSSDTIYMIMREDNKIAPLRRLVRERDNDICHYCGKFGDTVDHIIPVSKGGEEILENMICSCLLCNGAKNNMSYEEFKKIIEEKGIETLKREHSTKTKKVKKDKIKGYNKHGIPFY